MNLVVRGCIRDSRETVGTSTAAYVRSATADRGGKRVAPVLAGNEQRVVQFAVIG